MLWWECEEFATPIICNYDMRNCNCQYFKYDYFFFYNEDDVLGKIEFLVFYLKEIYICDK